MYLQITLENSGLHLLFLNFLSTIGYSLLIGGIFFLNFHLSVQCLHKVDNSRYRYPHTNVRFFILNSTEASHMFHCEYETLTTDVQSGKSICNLQVTYRVTLSD
jgi:hypothetical protein